MNKTEWIRCPVCGNKTRDKIRENTILKNFPSILPEMQTGNADKSGKLENNRYKEAGNLVYMYAAVYG